MATTTNALDALLSIRDGRPSARWNFPAAMGTPLTTPGGIGSAVQLTYSFPATPPAYFLTDGDIGFQAFSAAQRQAVRSVLAVFAEIANIRFTEVTGVGQLTYALSAQSGTQAGYAYLPGYSYRYVGATITATTELARSGDVWLNRNTDWSADAWLPCSSP